MHAINASSPHLWLGFHSFLKCRYSYNCSLNTVPKAWSCAPVIRKVSWLLQSLLLLGWDMKALKLSLCHNSGPARLALFAYWWFSGGALFYFPAWILQLYRDSFPDLLWGLRAATSLWVLLQYLAGSLQAMRGNRVHTQMFPPLTPITSLIHDFLI